MINIETFYLDFISGIEATRNVVVENKSPNAVDTLRIFWAADAAAKNQPFLVDAICFYHGNENVKRGENKEFICDFTLRSPAGEIILCLESEWGKLTSSKATLQEVVFDFKKLLCMLAPLKMMVFAYIDSQNEATILKEFSELLTKRMFTSHREQFIVLSTPWYDEMHSKTMKGYYWHQGDWSVIDCSVSRATRAAV